VAALKTELEKLGANVSIDENTMFVSGSVSVREARIKTYNDHRMAMAAVVLIVGAYGNTPSSLVMKRKILRPYNLRAYFYTPLRQKLFTFST